MTTQELLAIIGRLMVERDEARREVCNLMYQKGFPTGDYAKGRGWDCFMRINRDQFPHEG